MLLALLLALSMAASTVTGVVRDGNGGVVPGATVAVRTPAGAEARTVTGPDGRFSLETPFTGQMTLVVRASGFAEKQLPVDGGDLDVTLMPARISETVVVSVSRSEQRLGNIPASVSVLTSESIRTSPAVVADDVLRQVPTFSLFRRASSLVAQPTTQGVSLRGIGPSGQSRTLVLLDGVPFNDPFGGWVYWTRVPLMSVEQIEVTDGTASSLYGNYAMGGVISILTARPTRRTIEAKPQFGNYNSPKFDFFASDRWNKIGASLEGSWFDTDGFEIVAPRERGKIDIEAGVAYRNMTAKVEYDPTARVHASARIGKFSENRSNGKVGEVNDTNWTAVSGSVRALLPDNSTLQGSVFGDNEDTHFNFLAVANASTTRSGVRLATDQRVPVDGLGGSVQWQKVVGTQHVFTAGTDMRRVEGESQEDAYSPGTPVVPGPDGVTLPAVLNLRRMSGGAQKSFGAFASDVYTPTETLVLTLSARADYWKNYNGHNLETSVSTGLPTANNNPALLDRDDFVVSPRVAALYHVTSRLTTWAAVNSGFRAPTLTELYRQFSVGAVVTRPNNQLTPERLLGGEIGVNFEPVKNLTARVTWFDNRIKDPVSNVTLTATLSQKRNIGRTKIQGVQMDAEYRVGTWLRLNGAYLHNDAKVTDGGVENADLVGKFLAQVPMNRGSFQATYTNPKYVSLSLGAQFFGLQYNDDQNVNVIPAATLAEAGYGNTNVIGLPGYSSIDVTASRDFGRNLQVFLGVQNLADTVYFVQTNPSTTGTPRLFNGGVRIRWAGR